jgi:nucleotide-binding universal stress UspA family protein
METQHYLVPIDFSEHAERALQYAIELAQKVPARITLLHVIHTMPLGVTEMGASLPYAYLQEMEADIAQAMDAYLQQIQAAKLQGEVKTVHGVPFHEIVEHAKADRIDLIIMGTHGRTGLRHALLGSVAEKVVRLAPCSVLVTRLT